MAKDKKIIRECPLNDIKCDQCNNEEECQEIAAKQKKTFLSKIITFVFG